MGKKSIMVESMGPFTPFAGVTGSEAEASMPERDQPGQTVQERKRNISDEIGSTMLSGVVTPEEIVYGLTGSLAPTDPDTLLR